MSETSSEPELPAPGRSRWRHWRRWAVGLWAVAMLWYGWREYTYHRAVRTIEAAGYVWLHGSPGDLIRDDWRATFRKETWEETRREIMPRDQAVGLGFNVTAPPPPPVRRPDLAAVLHAIHRLQPTILRLKDEAELRTLGGLKPLKSLEGLALGYCEELTSLTGLEQLDAIEFLAIQNCPKLRDVSALRGLRGLKHLHIFSCQALQGVEGLNGLSSLWKLDLSVCPALNNIDGLRALPALQDLRLDSCSGLADVKVLHRLTSLKYIVLNNCDRLSAESVTALREALPQADIVEQ